jgi:hypothetical protein
MSIGLEAEATQDVRTQPSLTENRTRLLLMKRNNSDQRVLDIERMMALFDPNGS